MPLAMNWGRRLREMLLAGGALAATACGTGARVLMKGALVSVFVLVAALKTSASTSACGGKSCLPASDYDQSCTQDSDCVGIAEGQLCEQGCIGCANAAINVRDQAKYQSAVSGFSGTCSCPGVPIACNAGTCGLATFPSPAPEAGAQDAATDAAALACPDFQSQPTCPVAPGAVDCTRPDIGCGLDALPSGLSCSAPAQCSALIYPCPDWQKSIGGERTDGYICSCTNNHWSCDDCDPGAALCTEAPDGARLYPPPVVDAAADASAGDAADAPSE